LFYEGTCSIRPSGRIGVVVGRLQLLDECRQQMLLFMCVCVCVHTHTHTTHTHTHTHSLTHSLTHHAPTNPPNYARTHTRDTHIRTYIHTYTRTYLLRLGGRRRQDAGHGVLGLLQLLHSTQQCAQRNNSRSHSPTAHAYEHGTRDTPAPPLRTRAGKDGRIKTSNINRQTWCARRFTVACLASR
jgi:hypothetical protein